MYGWMDGEQLGKKSCLKISFFGKMVISSFGKYEKSHFTEKVNFFTTDLRKCERRNTKTIQITA